MRGVLFQTLYLPYAGGNCWKTSELFQRNENYRDIPLKVLKELNEIVLQIWREMFPAEGSSVQAYLKGRGYEGMIPPVLRFHPSLFHPSRTYHPAMVAVVTL